ncbi:MULTISPECIES: histidine kinase [unclassified Nostoc]|uniref:histidine kinase n=1 Tax=unclassified Nostoc TaxID=2593658 RepID=UPI0026045CFD|nr:histidine kinase [Nostoc sp. S13]MDF5736559.1 histidine kinase [Nostoc sp. S13]
MREARDEGDKGDKGARGSIQCPILLYQRLRQRKRSVLSAPCPMPHAPCPMPNAPCPMPKHENKDFQK